MMRLKIGGCALLTALAFTAFSTSEASAKPKVLTLAMEGEPLRLGEYVEFEDNTGVTIASKKSGTITCPTSGSFDSLTGQDLTNKSTKDLIEYQHSKGAFSRDRCSGTFTGLNIGAELEVYLQGGAEVFFQLESNLKVQVAAANLDFALHFTAPEQAHCNYFASKWKGSLALGKPISMTFSKVKMKLGLKEFDNVLCPKTVETSLKFDAAFGLNFEDEYTWIEGFTS
jgi:hypothetical protein